MKEKLEVSNNTIIVESENDRYFIKRLVNFLNIDGITIQPPICFIDDYECLDGLSETKLTEKLNEIRIEIEKRDIKKIGILVDADNAGIDSRLALINSAIQALDPTLNITEANHWYPSDHLDVKIACHILNLDGFGELETLLKEITTGDTIYAECLNAWKYCLSDSDISISEKEFNKFWVNIYQRYDNCTNKEKKQAGRKCNFEASLEKDIWDFSHPSLDQLRAFLASFD